MKNRSIIKLLFSRVALCVALVTMLFAYSCKSDVADSTLNTTPLDGDGLLLESFSVQLVGGTIVDGTIDNDARRVELSGLANGTLITDVQYTSNIDATFFPSLTTKIGAWDATFSATLLAESEDKGAVYTISLPDYDRGDLNILVVDLIEENKKQKILWIGADMERSQYSLQAAPNAQEMADWCFKDIPFPVLRMSYDKKQELTEGEKNFAFYKNCIKTMEYIEAANPDIKYWATLKSDYNGYNGENNYPDWISDYDTGSLDTYKYAIFLVDFLEYFYQQGHPISFISTSKEYVGVNTPTRTKEVIAYMREELVNRNVPIPLFNDASTWSVSQGASYVNGVVSNDFATEYWGFSTHNYNSDGWNYENFVSAITKANVSSPPTDKVNNPDGIYYAIASESGLGTMTNVSNVDSKSSMSKMLSGFRDKIEFFADGMHGELIFEIFSRSVASETRAVYCNYSAGTDAIRLSHYYAIKSHATFCKPGMYYYNAHQVSMRDDIYSMQFADDDNLYICITNEGAYAIDNFMIDLNDMSYNGAVEYHIMDEQTVKVEGNLEGLYYNGYIEDGKFEFELPAMSVAMFNITLSKSEGSSNAADGFEVEDFGDGGSAWK